LVLLPILLLISHKKNWIFDSGATDHITRNKNLLNFFTNWNTNQFVTVVNGEKMRIIGSGSIDLFSRNIPNVLYVQNYPTNMLSISKIAQELNCEIIFSSKSVIFQEWKMKNVIGEGFLKNGLYYINEKNAIFWQLEKKN
jgi:hypothetical protein